MQRKIKRDIKMIIQKILFPHESICTEKDLYFRGKEIVTTEDAKGELSKLIEKAKLEELKEDNSFFENNLVKVVLSGASGDEPFQITEAKKSDIFSNILTSCDDTSQEAVIFTQKDQKLSLDTYFNSFSVFKWKKYTNLNNLAIALDFLGHFKVEMSNVVRCEKENVVKTFYTTEIESDSRTKAVLQVPFNELTTGLLYIKLISLSEVGAFFGGEYITDIDAEEDIVSPVKIAIAMCTYKREEYVERNVNELSGFLINNTESPLHKNLELYIADNSQSLDSERLASESIHIFPNKNLGGAGGFGRAMYEILQEKDKKGYTNIIMMDDDVKFDSNVFERLFVFLSLQKEEYKEAHIGGAMLELDRMWMQSESGEYWYPKGHRAVKHRYDLRDLKWLLKNEIEDSVDNFGWWFCCMPISVVREDNLPLPIFIKRDDIEYGVRNGRQFITLNGVSIWHEAFAAKKVPFLDYYYYRNPMILNAGHCEQYNLMEMLDYFDNLRGIIDNDVNLYRYKEAHIKLQGIDDFLKGIDWLKAQDAVALNTTLMKRWTYQEENIEDVNCIFIHGAWEKNVDYTESEKQEEQRIRTNNGWDVPPTKGTVFAPLKNPHPGVVCGATKVVYYDEISQKGYVTHRSHAQRDAVYKHFDMTRKNLIENYDRVRKEYGERFNELTDISFWQNYLFDAEGNKEIPIQWWEEVADIPEHRRARAEEQLDQFKLEIKAQKEKIKDYPIVKNRVTIYLYQRRGFTCNVKYILKELLKETGDKLEIIWISDYPETCEELEKLGIPVVKAGTKKHWEYHFTARVNVTSDCQPPWFIKRDDQVAISAWHGGISYKVIGYDCLGASTDEELEIYGLKNKQPDYWLSGSQRFIDDTAYGFKHDKKSFLPTGMARNDIFFSDQSKLIRDVKKRLGIAPKTKVAMYAPTFRRGQKAGKDVFDIQKFKEALTERFGGKWTVLYRGHYFIKNNPRLEALDVSQYDDVQELLCITDVLVSDYSSIMWDYSFTGRPTFVFAADIDNYINNDRGFFIPVEEWPYPIARTQEELYTNIIDFNEDEFEKNIQNHHKKEGSFESGSSAKAACEIIKKACEI